MVLSVLNYAAILCFLSLMLFLAYVLLRYFKSRAKSPKCIHIKTAVIFATSTGVYLRKLKIENSKKKMGKLRRENVKHAIDLYSISCCDVPLQNYNIF
ncbi:hypothetical protein Zmor_003033 [Zophobas morio]|uniref:Uncharacterized protein n=1 Tax=Zophobas morio TaxID=2755281 RepID=A0AA38HRB3_9CUCU|nr:hypothetical protein Zmor_003033 [Zophobas morio]